MFTVKFKLPVIKTTINIAELKISSQLINCAVLLKDPKKAYLEFADHPASKIPYVAKEDTANIYSISKVKSAILKPVPKGIAAKPSNPNINVIIGPRKNKTMLACVGEIYSFNRSFRASATLKIKL